MKKTITLFAMLALMLAFNLSTTAQRVGKPERMATIAGISNGDIAKDLLLNSGVVMCSDEKYKVVYFSLSALKSSDLIVYSGIGNTLTESMKEMIKGLESGTKLIIEEIGAKSAKDKLIKLPAIILVLK